MILLPSEGTSHNWGVSRARSPAAKNQSAMFLESVTKKFKKDVANHPGNHGDSKVGSSKDVGDRPNYTSLTTHA